MNVRSLPTSALYVLSIVLGLSVWELAAANVSRLILAPPSQIALKLWAGIASGQLTTAFIGSLGHMFLGYGIAVAIALPLGLAMGRIRSIAHLLDPIVVAIYAIPPVALIPFIVIWFGIFFEARVALVVVMCFFEMLVTFATGARNVSEGLMEVGRSFAARKSTLIWKIALPAMVPFILTGLRLGMVRAIHAMIVAELFLTAVNLGSIMKGEAARFDSAGVLAVIVLLAVFGLVTQETIKLIERRMLVWRPRDPA